MPLRRNVRPRTFCIMSQRVASTWRKVKPLGVAVAKASLNRANKSRGADPKPVRSTHVQDEAVVTLSGGPNR